MNRYHATHPDPDIRRKYQEWLQASMHGKGYNSADEHKAAKDQGKAARKSVQMQLKALGGNVIKGGKYGSKVSTKQARKQTRMMQRTGGQRGS